MMCTMIIKANNLEKKTYIVFRNESPPAISRCHNDYLCLKEFIENVTVSPPSVRVPDCTSESSPETQENEISTCIQ